MKKNYLLGSLFHRLLFLLWALSLEMSSCAGNKPFHPFSKSQSFTKALIQADDSVRSLLSDSICDVVFNPKSKVQLYSVNVNAKPEDEGKRFGKFLVKDRLGLIKDDYLSVLTSMMADASFYDNSPFEIPAPFLPDAAVEFSYKRQTVVMLFCFNIKQFAIVESDGNLRYIAYNYTALVSQFFNRMKSEVSEK